MGVPVAQDELSRHADQEVFKGSRRLLTCSKHLDGNDHAYHEAQRVCLGFWTRILFGPQELLRVLLCMLLHDAHMAICR